MRIAYLAASAFPSTGRANPIQTMSMCSAFTRNGHETLLIAPDRPERLREANPHAYYGIEPEFAIEHLRWPNFKGRAYVYGWAAASRARRWEPNLVYGRSIPACLSATMLGMPTVIEVHQPVPEGDLALRLALGMILRRPALKRVVTLSESLRGYLERRFHAPRELLVLAPNGAEDATGIGNALELPPGVLHAGYVGGLQEGKGIELILQLASETPWASYHVVGGSAAEIEAWKKAAASVANLQFHGHVQPSEAARYRASFDVLLAPYRAGSGSVDPSGQQAAWLSPLKLPEYMATARPIVCSDLPAYREVLTHERTALLCNPEDVHAWARAMARLRDDTELRVRLGAAARQEFLDKYTWIQRAKRVLEGLG